MARQPPSKAPITKVETANIPIFSAIIIPTVAPTIIVGRYIVKTAGTDKRHKLKIEMVKNVIHSDFVIFKFDSSCLFKNF